MIEALNGRLGPECLKVPSSIAPGAANEKLECWRKNYDEARSHRALRLATEAYWRYDTAKDEPARTLSSG